jgi:hypothetical protein
VSAPQLEPRDYDGLLADVLARIPVHTPEWTNYNHADPGITLLELFAFMHESIAYRANLVPERNRERFLKLLGVPRRPSAGARGVVQLLMPRGGEPVVLATGLEVRAGQVPFRLETGLDVLPVEGVALVKRPLADPPPQRLLDLHRHLYSSWGQAGRPLDDLQLYETVPVGQDGAPTALARTVDRCIWIALLAAKGTPPAEARAKLAGRTLSLGIVPAGPATAAGHLLPGARPGAGGGETLTAWIPRTGVVVESGGAPALDWTALGTVSDVDVLSTPGIVQIPLPATLPAVQSEDPLEEGVGGLPPALGDPAQAARVITWLRVQAPAGSDARLVWAGVNAATVSQRATVAGELLGTGTGEPDQELPLAHAPVVAGTVTVEVTTAGGERETWTEIDDLAGAQGNRFVCDAAEGRLRFGDGFDGRRPPAGATLRAAYAYDSGAAGNVAAGQITSGALPAGVQVSNPVPTWGAVDAESVAEAERHAARWLQHRERLVTAEDIEAVARRTPGVEVGRVDVLSAYDPQLGAMPPGDAAGCVTVMVVPARDSARPDTPEPDQPFIDAVCRHLDPRRLATTELFVRGPEYVGVWVGVGFVAEAGRSLAELQRAIGERLRRYLAAVDPDAPWSGGPPAGGTRPRAGWPLGVAVNRLALLAECDRVDGVQYVTGVRLAREDGSEVDQVPLAGLQLPRLLGAASATGEPPDLDAVRGLTRPPAGRLTMPVPVVPEEC